MSQNSSTAATSLEYKNRLEEMELRIRYMKNDIEFKQGQISSKKDAASKQVVKPQMSSIWDRGKQHTVWRTSTLGAQSQPRSTSNPPITSANRNTIFEKCGLSHKNVARVFVKNNIDRQVMDHTSQSSYSSLNSKIDQCAQATSYSSHLRKEGDHIPSSVSGSFNSLSKFPSTVKTVSASSTWPSNPSLSTPTIFDDNSVSSSELQSSVQHLNHQSSFLSKQSTLSKAALPVCSAISSGSAGTITLDSHQHQPASPYKLVNSKAAMSKPGMTSSSGPLSSMSPADSSSVSKIKTSFCAATDATSNREVVVKSPGVNSRIVVQRFTPLKVQAAAKWVCSKYNLKRLSPTSTKSAQRFQYEGDKRIVIKSRSQFIQTHSSFPSNKYKLVKPKVASHGSVDPSSVPPPKADNQFKRLPNYGHNISQGSETSSPCGGNGRKRRLSMKSTSKSLQLLKLQRLKTVIPIAGSNHLTHTRFPRSSSYSQIPSSSKPISSQCKNVFKLDKRRVQGHDNFKASSFKLDKQDSNQQHPANAHGIKHKHSSKRDSSSSLYKWKHSQMSTIHRNAIPVYKWQQHPTHLQSGSFHHWHQSSFKWHRPNSNNGKKTIHRHVEMARLRQRLKVLMCNRNTVTLNRMMMARTAQKHQQSLSGTGIQSSPMKGKGKRREDVNKLVMIGHMLYRASSRKLTRANSENHLTRNQSPPSVSDRKAFMPASLLSRSNSFQPPQTKLPTSVVVKSLRRQKMKLVTVRGVRYHVEANGTKLSRVDSGPGNKTGYSKMSRVDIGGMTYVKTGPGTLELSCQGKKKMAASRSVHKSLSIVAAKQRKTGNSVSKSKQKQKHCTFFRRFGKCQRGAKCPFIHDPDKVAVCTRFLRGQCDNPSSCPFSHDASSHKMPVCLFYLQGLCSRQECRYLHVKVSPDAPVCGNFLQGFCPLGLKCKNLHSFVCPCYAVFGKCQRGDKCSLLHRQSKKQTHIGASKNQRKRRSSSTRKRSSNTNGEDNRPAELEESPSKIDMTQSCLSHPSRLSHSDESPSLSSSLILPSPPSSSPANSSSLTTASSDSEFKAQASFISLLSTSSAPFSSPSKQSPKKVPSLPALSGLSYKCPKITPEFLKPNKQNEVALFSKHNDKKLGENVVLPDSKLQKDISVTSAMATQPIEPSSLISLTCPLSSPSSSSPPLSSSKTESDTMTELKIPPTTSSYISLSVGSPITTVALLPMADESCIPVSQPIAANNSINKVKEKCKEHLHQPYDGFERNDAIIKSNLYQQDVLKFEIDTSVSHTFEPPTTSTSSSYGFQSVNVKKATSTTNSGNVTPQTSSAAVFNKGIIPSFMTNIMKKK